MKIAVLPPDVNQSRVKFAVTSDAIRFGLAAIRGVGSKPAEAIVATRESGGPFESLAEFCLRVGTQLVSRRVLEALIKCGAFDSIGTARASLMAEAENAIRIAQRAESDVEKNQIGLFGGAVKVPRQAAREPIPEWDPREKLKFEKEALGFYITSHPLDKYDRELARISKLTTADLAGAPDGSQVQIPAVIHAVKLKNNKAGKRYATFSLEDREGAVEAIAWSETYSRYEAIIMRDEPVLARGTLEVDDERAQIILESLVPLDSALLYSIRAVRITAPISRLENGGLDPPNTKLARHPSKPITHLPLDFQHPP